MTERANKDKVRRSLSLSKSRKKGSVKAGISASAAATTAPITSFFSSQPPPKLACPLCGQFVPRFKINEHIDLQCQNFERGDSNAASASNSVVPSIHLSPGKKPPNSPEQCPNKGAEEVEETKTSPYFKKNSSHQAPREINSKSVIRTIDLGSLSAKLSSKCHQIPERTQTGDKKASTDPEKEIYPDTLNSSQKENLLIESSEDQKECMRHIGLAETSADTPSCSDTGHNLEHKACKSGTVQKLAAPKLHSSSSKLAKRKNEVTSTGGVFGVRKKAKYKGRHPEEPADVLSGQSVAEKTETDPPKHEAPPVTTASDPPLRSEETYDTSAAAINSGILPGSGVESAAGDEAVEDSHPPRLPYYLRNFRTVLQAVLENEDDRALFNQHDMSHIHAFEKLSGMLESPSVNV